MQSHDAEYSTQVSYMEIYNENGYDLLDPNHDITKLEDLPKVLGLSKIIYTSYIAAVDVFVIVSTKCRSR